MPSEQLWDNAISNISFDGDGALHYESLTERRWTEAGEDFNLLLDIVGDNTYEEGSEDEPYEEIDWGAVQREYDQSRAGKQHAG
jgi:hypothetical protein